MKITFTWIDAAETPSETDIPIIYATSNGKLGTLKKTGTNWDWYKEKYGIAYWAYQRSILPE
jgi:hypothetical protein